MNKLQRQTLRDCIEIAVEELLNHQQMDLLKACISKPSEENMHQLCLELKIETINGILQNQKITSGLREPLTVLRNAVKFHNPKLLNVTDLSKLLQKYNYNPFNLLEIQRFHAKYHLLPEEVYKFALCIREAYLGMTPLQRDSYDDITYYQFRAGEMCFGLDTLGPPVSLTEIQQEITTYTKQLIEKFQKCSTTQHSTQVKAQEEMDYAFALSLAGEENLEEKPKIKKEKHCESKNTATQEEISSFEYAFQLQQQEYALYQIKQSRDNRSPSSQSIEGYSRFSIFEGGRPSTKSSPEPIDYSMTRSLNK